MASDFGILLMFGVGLFMGSCGLAIALCSRHERIARAALVFVAVFAEHERCPVCARPGAWFRL